MSHRFRDFILYSKFTDNVAGHTYGGRVLPPWVYYFMRAIITPGLYTFYPLLEVYLCTKVDTKL